MKDNFDYCLGLILKHEGGFVNHPKDPGGMTNLGVTKKVWEEYVGKPVDEATMRSLKQSDVGPLYKKSYWDKIHADELPSGVDYAMFDCAINSGTGRSAKFAQKICNVTPDGAIGPASLAAINRVVEEEGARYFIEEFNDARLRFLQALPTFETFGKGWSKRVSEVNIAAIDLARSGDS